MKYCEMVKFLNDNGICAVQPMIASELSGQLDHDIPEEEFEDICASVEETYIDMCCDQEPSIWRLVNDELEKRANIARYKYLLEKEQVCPLDKYERYELWALQQEINN